jgi:hypothetical protein
MVGNAINEILLKAYVEGGDMYAGFENLGRNYFALNAARYFDVSGEQGAIELVRVSCYKKASFERAFAIDADAFGTPPKPLLIGTFNPTYDGNADPYFQDETTVSVVRINNDYYVAGHKKNSYAVELIQRGDVTGTLNNFLNISLLTEGRINECR